MHGPLEYIAFSFQGNQFKGEIIPAVREVVENGTVRIIDLAFIAKDQDGLVAIRELQEIEPALLEVFDPLVTETSGLFLPSDLAAIGAMLEANSSAALVLFEHAWATTLAEAIAKANGRVVAREAIPAQVAQAALDVAAAGASSAG
jgi:hypothetical protein